MDLNSGTETQHPDSAQPMDAWIPKEDKLLLEALKITNFRASIAELHQGQLGNWNTTVSVLWDLKEESNDADIDNTPDRDVDEIRRRWYEQLDPTLCFDPPEKWEKRQISRVNLNQEDCWKTCAAELTKERRDEIVDAGASTEMPHKRTAAWTKSQFFNSPSIKESFTNRFLRKEKQAVHQQLEERKAASPARIDNGQGAANVEAAEPIYAGEFQGIAASHRKQEECPKMKPGMPWIPLPTSPPKCKIHWTQKVASKEGIGSGSGYKLAGQSRRHKRSLKRKGQYRRTRVLGGAEDSDSEAAEHSDSEDAEDSDSEAEPEIFTHEDSGRIPHWGATAKRSRPSLKARSRSAAESDQDYLSGNEYCDHEEDWLDSDEEPEEESEHEPESDQETVNESSGQSSSSEAGDESSGQSSGSEAEDESDAEPDDEENRQDSADEGPSTPDRVDSPSLGLS